VGVQVESGHGAASVAKPAASKTKPAPWFGLAWSDSEILKDYRSLANLDVPNSSNSQELTTLGLQKTLRRVYIRVPA
jgi:hypothetical protein